MPPLNQGQIEANRQASSHFRPAGRPCSEGVEMRASGVVTGGRRRIVERLGAAIREGTTCHSNDRGRRQGNECCSSACPRLLSWKIKRRQRKRDLSDGQRSTGAVERRGVVMPRARNAGRLDGTRHGVGEVVVQLRAATQLYSCALRVWSYGAFRADVMRLLN